MFLFVRDISLRFPSSRVATTGSLVIISPHEMLRSATILAFVSATTAAGTYPTDDESCSLFKGQLACGMHDETACGTDTNCKWDTNENERTTTEEFEMPFFVLRDERLRGARAPD